MPATSAVMNSAPETGRKRAGIIARSAHVTGPVRWMIVPRCVSSYSWMCEAIPLKSAACMASVEMFVPRRCEIGGAEKGDGRCGLWLLRCVCFRLLCTRLCCRSFSLWGGLFLQGGRSRIERLSSRPGFGLPS